MAQNSTLLLDEISMLPLSMQPKLLRVLEEKNLNKVGSSKNIPLNVRVITASNTDLQGLCVENKFRIDLYYRLNIFAIHIPPLRDRKEDIPVLFDHFTNQAALLHHKDPVSIQRQALNMLLEYPFPGNIRELKNIAERIIILNDEPRITVKTLESVILPGNRHDHRLAAANLGIAHQEADLIVDALRQSENVIARAARLLHITDQSLLRRIKKFGITIPG
jgi:Nif-specific regulatory protein